MTQATSAREQTSKILIAIISLILIPTIGYIYTEGRKAESQDNLALAISTMSASQEKLSDTVSELTLELREQKIKSINTTNEVNQLKTKVNGLEGRMFGVEARVGIIPSLSSGAG